jgi:hypothetical protein
MSAGYHYFKSCVDHAPPEVAALNAMIEAETDITLRTMRGHCAGLAEWAADHGYEANKRHGLTLAGDWHVSYHRSTYGGKRCYFLRWSAIEFIWCQP